MRLENVGIHINGQEIVKPVSLEIYKGEIFVLMGPSGSGKTTLLRGMANLQPFSTGTMTWEKQQGKVGIAFQEPRLFPHMTVQENIAFGLRVKGFKKKVRREEAASFIRILQLDGLEDRYPHQLSGGQKQRVSLGRSLILAPDLLLLDEPFSSLDASLRMDLTEWLYQLQREKGFSLLWVTHYLEEAFAVADTIGVMMDGELLQVGKPMDVYRYPASEKIAHFFALPNRFSKENWHAFFPSIKPKDEMGWVPAESLMVYQTKMTEENFILEGVLERVKYERNGCTLFILAFGHHWEVFISDSNPSYKVGDTMEVIILYDKIIWYPK